MWRCLPRLRLPWRDEENLYRILRNNASERYGEEYAKGFDNWKEHVPQFYKGILQVIPLMIQTLNAKFSYEQLDNQRIILKKNIEEVIVILEEKLK